MLFYVASWWPEPSHLCNHEWCYLLLAVPRPAELWPPEACSQLDTLPSPPFLHGWLCTTDIKGIPAVPCPHRPRADPADVGCQEHDVRSWPTTWALPDSINHVLWEDEHQGGGRADAECAEQELVLLRGVDPNVNCKFIFFVEKWFVGLVGTVAAPRNHIWRSG